MKLISGKRGFTLTEVLVASTIIIILSGIVVVNYQSGKSRFSLQRSVNKLAQDVRRAQEMAMSVRECPTGTGCEGQIPAGYGIFVEEGEKQYILYADTNPNDGNEKYDSGGGGNDDIVEVINLEKGVEICDVEKPGPGVGPPRVSINFKPPDPKVNVEYPNNLVEIIFGTDCAVPANTKKVTINAIGLVEID